MDRADVDFTLNTLSSALHQYKERVNRGRQIRLSIHESIEQTGKTPEHYRVDWLKNSVVRIFHELEAIALDFNTEHTDDCCSSNDLADVLSSALATMREEFDED
jgi:hypothetical protein